MSQTEFFYVTPVLPSLNIAQSAEFYTHKMSFTVDFQSEDYLVIKREHILLHFWLCDNPIIPPNTSCYIWVGNIMPLYEELKAKITLTPENHLHDTPWGFREFGIIDIHGNHVHFAEHRETP